MIRAAPPATYGVAAEVPEPVVAVEPVVVGPSVAHDEQASDATFGMEPGQVAMYPESYPRTMIGAGPRCGASRVGWPSTPSRNATPLPAAQNASCVRAVSSTARVSAGS